MLRGPKGGLPASRNQNTSPRLKQAGATVLRLALSLRGVQVRQFGRDQDHVDDPVALLAAQSLPRRLDEAEVDHFRSQGVRRAVCTDQQNVSRLDGAVDETFRVGGRRGCATPVG